MLGLKERASLLSVLRMAGPHAGLHHGLQTYQGIAWGRERAPMGATCPGSESQLCTSQLCLQCVNWGGRGASLIGS